jgi:hypothetical protein
VSTGIDTWRKEGEGDQARCCEAEKILVFYGVDENSRILSCLSFIGVKNILKCFFFNKKMVLFSSTKCSRVGVGILLGIGKITFLTCLVCYESWGFSLPPKNPHTSLHVSISTRPCFVGPGLALLGQAFEANMDGISNDWSLSKTPSIVKSPSFLVRNGPMVQQQGNAWRGMPSTIHVEST